MQAAEAPLLRQGSYAAAAAQARERAAQQQQGRDRLAAASEAARRAGAKKAVHQQVSCLNSVFAAHAHLPSSHLRQDSRLHSLTQKPLSGCLHGTLVLMQLTGKKLCRLPPAMPGAVTCGGVWQGLMSGSPAAG